MNTPMVIYRGGPSCHEFGVVLGEPREASELETLVLVPIALWEQLGDPLIVHFAAVGFIQVALDWRLRERRRCEDRRSATTLAVERRQITELAGRRLEDRRVAAARVPAPPMPLFARPYLEKLEFVRRELLADRAERLLDPRSLTAFLGAGQDQRYLAA